MSTGRGTAAAIAAALGLMIAGCTNERWQAESTSWQFVPVDHEVHTGTPPPAMADGGPPPGVLELEWTAEVPVDEQAHVTPQFHVAGGSLVAVTGWGVVGYDAATGVRRWHYREPGRTMLAGVAAGTVVLATGGNDFADFHDYGQGRLVGLDTATGQLLWQRRNQWQLGWRQPRLHVADPVVPVLAEDRLDSLAYQFRLVGLDARTGEPAWDADMDHCGVLSLDPPHAGDGSLLLVQSSCRGEDRWRAYDPATGRLLWTRPLPWSDITVSDRNVIARAPDQVLLVDPTGATTTHEVGLSDADEPVGVYLPVRTNHDLFAGSDLVDLRTGQTVSQSWPPLPPDATAWDDTGVLYALDNHRGPVPGLAIGNPADGDMQWLPIPGSATVDGPARWVGAAGGRLLVARQPPARPDRLWVFAYRSTPTDGPVPLGGVPLPDWPDPCDLPPFAGATGGTERFTSAPMRLGAHEYPTRACRVLVTNPDRGGVDGIDVEVIWVAVTDEHASRWLGGQPGPPGVDELVDYQYSMLARIGRVIVELRGYTGLDPQPLLQALAEQLAGY